MGNDLNSDMEVKVLVEITKCQLILKFYRIIIVQVTS